MVKFIAFVCDGPDCGKEAFSTGNKVPEGWQSLRYTPGILKMPGQVQLAAGRYEFCSPTCVTNLLPSQTVRSDEVP